MSASWSKKGTQVDIMYIFVILLIIVMIDLKATATQKEVASRYGTNYRRPVWEPFVFS